jgi:hypothetical protein
MAGLGKQAKVLTERQIKAALLTVPVRASMVVRLI